MIQSTLLFTPFWRIISPCESNVVITARCVRKTDAYYLPNLVLEKWHAIKRRSRKSEKLQCKIIVMNQIVHYLILSVTMRFISNSSNPSKSFNARKHYHRRMCYTSEWATARLTIDAFRVNYAALTVNACFYLIALKLHNKKTWRKKIYGAKQSVQHTVQNTETWIFSSLKKKSHTLV